MTHCEHCHKEIKTDHWREHLISGKHPELEKKDIVKFET